LRSTNDCSLYQKNYFIAKRKRLLLLYSTIDFQNLLTFYILSNKFKIDLSVIIEYVNACILWKIRAMTDIYNI